MPDAVSRRGCAPSAPIAAAAVAFTILLTLLGPTRPAMTQSKTAASPLAPSSVPADNLDRQWRVWRRQLEAGTPTLGPLQAIRVDAVSLGRPNPRVHLMASLHALRPGGGDALQDSTDRRDTYRALSRLAPDLPYAPLGHAWSTIRLDPSAAGEWLSAYVEGLRRATTWLDTNVAWGGRLATAGILALIGIILLGAIISVIRHLPVVGYDLARLFPRGITRLQATALLVLSICAVGLSVGSYLVGLVALFGIVSAAQRPTERLPAFVLVAILIAGPFVSGPLGDMTRYPASTAQQSHLAMQTGCDQRCRLQLEQLDPPTDALDALRDYALAVVTARQTHPEDLRDALTLLRNRSTWPPSIQPWRTQLVGAIHAARGRLDEAMPHFKQAARETPRAFSVHFNTMKTARRLGNKSAARAAREQADSIAPARLDRYASIGAANVNTQLILPSLPNDAVWSAHTTVDGDHGLWGSTWQVIHGTDTDGRESITWGVGLLVALLGTWFVQYLQPLSRPCPNCGGPREPADADRTGGHPYCHPCYRAFVSSGSLHHRRRIRVEQTLRRRGQRRATMHRVFSAVAPGSGHLLAGHPLRGVLAVGATTFGVSILVGATIVGPPPGQLFGIDWAGWTVLGTLALAPPVLVGLWTAARGLEPFERTP